MNLQQVAVEAAVKAASETASAAAVSIIGEAGAKLGVAIGEKLGKELAQKLGRETDILFLKHDSRILRHCWNFFLYFRQVCGRCLSSCSVLKYVLTWK